MFNYRQHHPQHHICGLYYNVNVNYQLERTYIPQVELEAHATVLETTARVNLKQTFLNPSQDRGIQEVRYTFPLYDGVTVVGFTCHVGARTIVGEVKEKEKAKAEFKEAVEQGKTAGLLEQLPDASDIFSTTVGNIPPGAKVIINITYLGELKHDMEVDGTRFTIPNIICPRYGNYPSTLQRSSATDAAGKKISITVDAKMAEGSFIQKIQSPSHPIAIQMGTTSAEPNAEPTMTRASATLSLGTSELETDFILQVVAKNTGVPKAVLEVHPTIPKHRALMATLVPKFALPPEKPEIVFVCDRSGSMGGTRIQLVVEALKVFLKSLPVGVKFNICSFGSSHSFLWPSSVTYSQQTLDEAIHHASTFEANYGGTEMLEPLRATVERRYQDMPLEVILLTDGEIWNQDALFSYLNGAIHESKEPIRMFTLGIGNGVSHALIEGVARAGNGFSQSVGEGEKMDTKVVRMLKGALSPHINDYKLEVKYHAAEPTDDIDDFEIVEKIADSLNVKLDLADEKVSSPEPKKTISLFDPSADPDKEEPPTSDATGEQKYAHLPQIAVPRIIQAPQDIPSLFAFNRTTVYLLLGPDAPQDIPAAVILRGTSKHGPLELEIPIAILDTPGETIHQLAAKKAVAELEQGRGWLHKAKDETGALLTTKHTGRFSDMVEREAVRLGVQFQVGGKWTSFVALESNDKLAEEQERESEDWEWLEDAKLAENGHPSVDDMLDIMQQQQQQMGIFRPSTKLPRHDTRDGENVKKSKSKKSFRAMFSNSDTRRSPPPGKPQFFANPLAMGGPLQMAGGLRNFPSAPNQSSGPGVGLSGRRGGSRSALSAGSSSLPMFQPQMVQPQSIQPQSIQPQSIQSHSLSHASKASFGSQSANPFGSYGSSNITGGLFGASPSPSYSNAPRSGAALFGAAPAAPAPPSPFSSSNTGLLKFGGAAPIPPPPAQPSPLQQQHTASYSRSRSSRSNPTPDSSSSPQLTTPTQIAHHLISFQLFSGAFPHHPALLSTLATLNIPISLIQSTFAHLAGAVSDEVIMTALVIAVFEKKLQTERGSWELVVEKARGWVEGEVGTGRMEEVGGLVEGVVGMA